jgi:hypothetical protein
VKDRQHVDVIDLAERRLVRLHQRAVRIGPACVVDHDIQAAKRLGGFLDRRRHLRAVSHIATDCDGLISEAGGDFLRSLLVQIDDGNACALGHEKLGNSLAKAGGRTRYQCRFALESHTRLLSRAC